MFAQSGGLDNLFQAISAVTGNDFGNREWRELGVRCLTSEVQFNRRAGLTEEDDRLPAMFYKEKLLPYHGTVTFTGEELDAVLETFTI
jgi:aldehyde:ferredoxin oxidoreductase